MDATYINTQEFLTYFPQTVFQFFGDKDKQLPAKTAVKYDESKFKSLNDKGYGVYFTPQSFPSGKRKSKEPHMLNALYIDLDVTKEGQNLEVDEIIALKTEALNKLQSYKSTPHFVVETKNGLQAFWLIESTEGTKENDDKYISAIEFLIQEFNADPGAKDVARVLRLPGFLHQKDPANPFECKLIYSNIGLSKYNLNDFEHITPPTNVEISTVKGEETKEDPYNGFFGKLPLHKVLHLAAHEADIEIEYKLSDGKRQVIENGEQTSAFINKKDTYCHSMSENGRSGGAVDIVKYYLGIDDRAAVLWIFEKMQKFYFPSLTLKEIPLTEVHSKTDPIGLTNKDLVEIVLATYISIFLPGEKVPVWLMLVGVPSSNKTTLLELIKSAPSSYSVDTLTDSGFASGLKESKDLLAILNNKVLLIKDYTSLFCKNDDAVRSFIGELTNIYDGHFDKHSPTRGTVHYECNMNHIGAITPQAMEQRKMFMSQLGARFLQVHIPELTEEEKTRSFESIWSNFNFKEAVDKAVTYGSSFAEQLSKKDLPTIGRPSEELVEKFNLLSEFLAQGRGVSMGKIISYQDENDEWQKRYEQEDSQVEVPFRAVKQLRQLATALAVVRGKETITEEEFNIVRKIVLSSMDKRRADILRLFDQYSADKAFWTQKEIANALGLNEKTAERHLRSLVSFGLLKDMRNTMAFTYWPADKYRSLIMYSVKP